MAVSLEDRKVSALSPGRDKLVSKGAIAIGKKKITPESDKIVTANNAIN